MIQVAWGWFRTRLASRQRDERGLTTVEYVVLGAVLVVGVATVGAILVAKLTNKVNSINL